MPLNGSNTDLPRRNRTSSSLILIKQGLGRPFFTVLQISPKISSKALMTHDNLENLFTSEGVVMSDQRDGWKSTVFSNVDLFFLTHLVFHVLLVFLSFSLPLSFHIGVEGHMSKICML